MKDNNLLLIYINAIIMTLFFIITCVSIVLLFKIIKERKKFSKILLIISTIISGLICTIFATEARTLKFSRELPDIIEKVLNIPVFVYIIIFVIFISFIVFTYINYNLDKKRKLSNASIKESLDKLPTGLCFARINGRVILSNNKMNHLSHIIIGMDLQNAMNFWNILSSGEVTEDIERLEYGENPSFKLNNGKIWTFSYTKLNDIIQIVASDTTELSEINSELKLRKEELLVLNDRLFKYGESVDELTRTKERIEIKVNIHRELGQAILATKSYLADKSNDSQSIINIWKKNIAMLKRQIEYVGNETPVSEFLKAAENAGAEVKITGNIPTDIDQNRLFVRAAVECLINSIRHANATTLYITVKEIENEIVIIYENDGEKPKQKIIEGGGISSLRYETEKLCGKIEIVSNPSYSLMIYLPKRKEKN